MEKDALATSYPGVDIEGEKLPLPVEGLISGHTSDKRKRQFIAPGAGFMFTPSPDLPALEQITTIRPPATTQEWKQAYLPTLQTEIVPVVNKNVSNDIDIEQFDPPQMMAESQATNIEDDDAIVLQTVSISAVQKKRAKKKINTFFNNIVILLLSILFLVLLAIAIILLSNPMYKAVAILLSLVVLSYVVSLQVKFIYRVRQQTFLTVTQMVHAVGKKSTSSRNRDMKHMTLIKEDTTTFLRAITKKDLNKKAR